MEYKEKNNTFVQVAQEDPRDFLEAEVGDIKQEKFHPQVKIKRWNNMSNLSVRYKHTGKGKESVKKEGNKIMWKKGYTEAHFYDIDGGYEFEVIYHKKPETNVTEFTIQTKGLQFFYQPELTQADIDRGVHRPENVVGSYAIYTDKKRRNYEGGRLWRSGKVGHIFRPKVFDSAGREVWGILNIDVEKEILSVTVPQEFLDTATYPVIVDPTIGYDTVGASDLDVGSDYNAFCSLWETITAGSGDILQSLHFYARKLSANETVAVNMYRIQSAEPTTKLGMSDASINVNSSTPQWWNATGLNYALTAGYEYGVAYGGWGGTAPNENTQIYFDTSSGDNISYNSATSLSSNWNHTDPYFSDLLSLYAIFLRGPIDVNYTYKIFVDKAKPA